LGATVGLGAALALVPGCGEGERVVVAPSSVYERPARPPVLSAPGDFDAGEVRETVARFTGHRLEGERRAEGLVSLDGGPGSFPALGAFNLWVARDRRSRVALARRVRLGRPYVDEGIRLESGGQATATFGDTVYESVGDMPSRLGPGEQGEALFVFDVPAPLATRAERDGTLVLTGRSERPFDDLPGSPRNSPTVVRLRLRPAG